MDTYLEPSRAVEVIENVDVLVVGGGPAGVGAAVGAARCGASCMIIETMGSFGGMWTNGLVITLAGFNNWLRPYQRVVDGVMGEWIRRAEALGGCENNRSWVLNSDPEIMRLVADDLLLSSGVKCLLHTWVADVIMEGNKVRGVLVENVEGRKAIQCKVIVDCTGNGDMFARAGEPFHISDQLQPMTMAFFLADWQANGGSPFDEELVIPMGPEAGYLTEDILREYTSRRRDVDIDRDMLREAAKAGQLPVFGGPWFGGLRERFPWVNTTRIYGSAISAVDLTRAEMEGRKNVHDIVAFYRRNCKGFEKSWVMKTSSTIGIRETRRLQGVYTLTGDDVVNGTRFEDTIAVGTWPIDVHPPQGHTGMHRMYVPVPYHIPYRALLPTKTDNLIVAGRCISADRDAMGSLRVGATCGAIGHAAGVAAALSAMNATVPRALNVNEIQDAVTKQNGIIDIKQIQALPTNTAL